ncbi:MAG: stage II sporulation protein P [Clostridia bacterium]|nr:stage II sporulation protein P [Clostridia bacterium]
MKHYKAVVIDAKKVVKRGLEMAIIMVIAILALINLEIADAGKLLAGEFFNNEQIIRESLPVLSAEGENGEGVGSTVFRWIQKAASFTLGFDPYDRRTVVFGQIPLVRTVSGGYLAVQANEKFEDMQRQSQNDAGKQGAETQQAQEYPIKAVDSSQSKTLGEKSGEILVRNDTDFGVNIDEMLGSELGFDVKSSATAVLIVHTHATESYAEEGAKSYQTDKSDRSLDENKNVIKVGEAVKNALEKKGIRTIHDKTLHDHPNFNGSYENSRKTVEGYLEKNPGIKIVLDIHRDAFVYDDGSKAKFVTKIDGKETAQLMFVVGSSGGGLEHPNWRSNMKLAVKLQNHINKKYPTLMRGINLRNERFNGHLTHGSLILEVGSSGNTMEEAIRGATLGAEEIADFLNKL